MQSQVRLLRGISELTPLSLSSACRRPPTGFGRVVLVTKWERHRGAKSRAGDRPHETYSRSTPGSSPRALEDNLKLISWLLNKWIINSCKWDFVRSLLEPSWSQIEPFHSCRFQRHSCHSCQAKSIECPKNSEEGFWWCVTNSSVIEISCESSIAEEVCRTQVMFQAPASVKITSASKLSEFTFIPLCLGGR